MLDFPKGGTVYFDNKVIGILFKGLGFCSRVQGQSMGDPIPAPACDHGDAPAVGPFEVFGIQGHKVKQPYRVTSCLPPPVCISIDGV